MHSPHGQSLVDLLQELAVKVVQRTVMGEQISQEVRQSILKVHRILEPLSAETQGLTTNTKISQIWVKKVFLHDM